MTAFFKTSLGDYINLAHVTSVVDNMESTGEFIVHQTDGEDYTFTSAEETTEKDVARLRSVLDALLVPNGGAR